MDWALASEIGSRIRMLRLSHNWSQAELARRIGVNKSVIGFYELGERFPTYDVLIRLCKLFAVTSDYLIMGDEASHLDSLTDDQKNAIRTIIAGLSNKSE